MGGSERETLMSLSPFAHSADIKQVRTAQGREAHLILERKLTINVSSDIIFH